MADRDGERVGCVIGLRWLRQPEQRPDHSLHLVLGCASRAAHGHLHGLGRVVEARHLALRGGEHRNAASLADADRRAHVLSEVDVLERHCGRLVPRHELSECGMDTCQPQFGRILAGCLDDPAIDRAHLRSREPHDSESRVRHPRVNSHDHEHGY
jgi:hypothetical protein